MPSLKLALTPPQNYLVEEIILGCILINPLIFSKVIYNIKIESFFLESHQLIYIHLLNIYHNDKLNPIELLYSLSDSHHLYQIGGIKKIIELMKQSQIFIYSNHTNTYIDKLIEILNSNYIKRLVIQYGYNIIQLSYIKKINGHILYNKASHYLNITVDKMPKNHINNFHELMKNLIYDMQIITNTKSKKIIPNNQIIKSGFNDLDQLTNGLPIGDLIVLAARPSMGKTSFAINMAYNILQKSTCSICIFSLEMSSKQIINKFISISSNIPYTNLLNPYIYNNNWKIIKDACKKLLRSNMYIYDQPNVSIDYIEYISKIWIKDISDLGLIIIDYLQLIQADHLINVNRVQQLNYITRKLKILAQYLNVPVLTLSQLNRSIETRINKQPVLSDLKESGCINQNININITNKYKYMLYATSLLKHLHTLKTLNTYIIQSNILKNNLIFNIHFSYEYIFSISYTQGFIQLTHHHKCLYLNLWLNVNKLKENNRISLLVKKLGILKKHILQYSSLYYIESHDHNIVYDLLMTSYIYFTCHNLLLHNSIEQDADIVLMLYQKNNDHAMLNKDKNIVDLIISKNRHGPVGSCQLVFFKENTSFQNVESNNTNYIKIQ